MKIIVGLGNPGRNYVNTYHNVGFDALDRLAQKLSVKFSLKSKMLAEVAQCNYMGEKVVLVKPQTYMNLSGDSIAAALNFFKADISDLLVIYDELDIQAGILRCRKGGSGGTHNGMRDILSKLSSGDFARVRIGTAKDNLFIPTAEYVLSKISTERRTQIDCAIDDAVLVAIDFIKGVNFDRIMCAYNGKNSD